MLAEIWLNKIHQMGKERDFLEECNDYQKSS